MKPMGVALVTAVALLCSHLLAAQTPTSAGLVRHVAARSFALVMKADGSVVGWGREEDGLAAKPRSPSGVVGSPVAIALGPVAVPGLEGITQIAAGRTHNLALRRDGRVMSWGTNSEGELGIGTRLTGWTPAEAIGLDRVVAIDAGGAARGSSGAIRADGTFWIWGFGYLGQGILGKNLHVPTRLDLP